MPLVVKHWFFDVLVSLVGFAFARFSALADVARSHLEEAFTRRDEDLRCEWRTWVRFATLGGVGAAVRLTRFFLLRFRNPFVSLVSCFVLQSISRSMRPGS